MNPIHTPAEGDLFSEKKNISVLLPGVLFKMQSETHQMAPVQLEYEDQNVVVSQQT